MGDIKDEILIDIVKRCPIVWDLRQQNYRNTGVKDDAWAKIGKSMNCTGNEARLRFATLREKFRKEKIVKEKFANLGTETYKEQWPLYDIMSFLAPVIKPRRKRTTMSMDGGDSFLDYTYKEEPFNTMSMDVNPHEHEHRNNQVTDMKPGFPSLAQDILPVTVFDQQHDNEAIATSTSHQYHHNIKISSPSSNSSQNYLRSRSNSPSHHTKQLNKTNQLLQELNSVTSTLKKNNNLDRDQFQTFGEFVGDHLSSLPLNQANTLMKNIMQEIINFPK